MRIRKNGIFAGIILLFLCFKAGWDPVYAATEITEPATVTYRTHVQTYGWQNLKRDGETSGTTGESKRLEAIEINLNSVYSGGIEYRTHVQSYGWMEWESDGQMAGTTGQAKRLEAIEIRLTGDIANYYDIYYRTHVQSYGWMGWAKNGSPSGSSGLSKRLEAVEIKLLPKNESMPEDGKTAYMATDSISYSVHVQTYGWQPEKENGTPAGTTGEAKRLEAIQIFLKKANDLSGGVQYRTHVQTYGWMDWVEEGQISGTSGQAKRLEAIQIRLTGEMAEAYDIYYRVHAQTYGWLGWAVNGQPAGTAGQAKRLEAIEIVLKRKGEAAPGSTSEYYHFQTLGNLMDTIEGIGDASQIITVVGDGTAAGADLSFWEKKGNHWTEGITTKADIGINGLSDHTREGDKTTPTGCYGFGVAFGNKANPGTILDWIDVNPYHYWVDDLSSSYYNQLIDSREIPDGWNSGEHLIEYVPSYNYSVNIEVNPECRKDSTSAIFLHCFGSSRYTSGCVAIEENQMRTILQRLEPNARIVIMKNREELLNYVTY